MTGTTQPFADDLRRILDAVRRRVKPGQFETWFARTTLLRMAPNEVVLGLPNQFLLEWLTREYQPTVDAAVREAVGRPVEIRFAIDARLAPGAQFLPGTGPDSAARDGHVADGAAPDRDSRPGTASPAPSPPNLSAGVGDGQSPAPSQRPLARASRSPSTVPDLPTIVLQPRYTFDNFVVGPSNQLPHAVARAVAEHPGGENNPLFLYGAVGLGKTHLLQAICHEVLRRRPDARIAYLSCEQFTNEYVSAVQRSSTEGFRARFRNLDILVIDDIHFLANKERTQEEFFHTFNALYQQRKQIILSSDAAPTEIPTLEERLVSRFRWGVVAPIEPPEVETRMAIVRRKAESLGLSLPADVVELVATNARSNIRELEGAIASLRTRAAIDGGPIDLAMARAALEPLMREDAAPIGIERIAQVVAAHYGAKLTDLRSAKRTKSISMPRQVAMYVGREETSLSLVEIGEYFGGRDHTTVLYAVDKVARRVADEEAFRTTVERLRDRARAR